MRNDFYPQGTVNSLLQSEFVNAQTKKVLEERLQKTQRPSPHFFSAESFEILRAVCDCLFPQEHRSGKIPLAILLEDAILNSKGKGWRFDAMPPMNEAVVQGLKAIDAEAKEIYSAAFIQLSQEQKKHLLTAIQNGTLQSTAWNGLPSNLFFTELLAQLTELYYSHPFAREDIGDVSFADEGGWQHIGLNNLEEREPQPLKTSSDAKI